MPEKLETLHDLVLNPTRLRPSPWAADDAEDRRRETADDDPRPVADAYRADIELDEAGDE